MARGALGHPWHSNRGDNRRAASFPATPSCDHSVLLVAGQSGGCNARATLDMAEIDGGRVDPEYRPLKNTVYGAKCHNNTQEYNCEHAPRYVVEISMDTTRGPHGARRQHLRHTVSSEQQTRNRREVNAATGLSWSFGLGSHSSRGCAHTAGATALGCRHSADSVSTQRPTKWQQKHALALR